MKNLELDLDIKNTLLRVSVHVCFELEIWRSRDPQNIVNNSGYWAEKDWEALVWSEVTWFVAIQSPSAAASLQTKR